ncbi:hypothetical protein [uncultured Kordia sp.]|uniref:hypothetical protein n=1 Tax=uncultured Kordia sp. TaxID=507699 RepID=UPI0026134075|nr:hypothetical protein [uncultured Kordia sp.]
MKKYLTLLLVFCIQVVLAQDIVVEEGIAYIEGEPYVKIIKKNKKNFFIYDLKTNKQIIKVQLSKKYNVRAEKYYPNTKIYFLKQDIDAAFPEVKVTSQKDIVQLLLNKELILPNGSLNEEYAREYHEITPIGKRCKKTLKKDFGGILYHKFRPIVGNDTIEINEVKYECVSTAFYTKKVLYDRFGNWSKEIYRNASQRLPELVWMNVKLFEDDDKKFTIVARGLESRKTIYASIMVFDENNYDMLDEKSPYRDKVVALFSDFIRNDTDSKKFYKAYWTKYDPKGWMRIQEQKRRMTSARKHPYSPFTQPTSESKIRKPNRRKQ